MQFLLFSGPQNCGKTTSILYYKDLLISKYGYTSTHIVVPHLTTCYILEKGTTRILVYPDADTAAIMDEIPHQILSGKVDFVISANRSVPDWQRNYFFKLLGITSNFLEIPLGRMVRGTSRSVAVTWYLDSVLKIAEKIGSQPPFSF